MMGDWVPFPQPGGPANTPPPPHKYQPQKQNETRNKNPKSSQLKKHIVHHHQKR
jgi:hypothetical protein